MIKRSSRRSTLEALEAKAQADAAQVDLFAAPSPVAAPAASAPDEALASALAAIEPDGLSPREALGHRRPAMWDGGDAVHPLMARSPRYEPMRKISDPSERIV